MERESGTTYLIVNFMVDKMKTLKITALLLIAITAHAETTEELVNRWNNDPAFNQHSDQHNYALDRLEQSNYEYEQQLNYQRQYEQRERQIQQMERENEMFERALNSIGNQR